MSVGCNRVIGFLLILMTTVGCGGGGGGGGGTIAPAGVAPAAQFTISTDIGSFPLVVAFDASASTDSDGTITRYDWQFGDGTTGSGSRTQHTYTAAGSYTAQLTVTDDSGLNDSASKGIDVKARYTISGTITSAEHVVADSDVNDSNATPVSNDSFATAQAIPSPVSVSGYVNVASAGPSGASWVSGDPNDYYRVSLIQGMGITLYMAEDAASAELNLYLYDHQQTLLEASQTGDDAVVALIAPQDGTYYVRVEAVDYFDIRTASVYTLTIGRSGPLAAQSSIRLSDDFVPGDALVRFDAPTQGSAAAFSQGLNGLSTMGLYTKSGLWGRDKLLRRSDTVDKKTFFRQLGVESALASSIGPGNLDPPIMAKLETWWMIRALRRQPGIQFAEPNYIRRPLRVPNDSYYAYQWHFPLIRLPEAWDTTTGSSDVVVAVVDTGVLLGHPDLVGRFVDGYDFISNPAISLDGDGIDANPDDPGDDDVGGSSFHGTHVAGTIAAGSNNGKGVAGIAWNTTIMPLRALGKGGGTLSDILEAVKYAAGLENDSGRLPAKRADIINLSLGGDTYSQIEAAVYADVRDQGVIVIAAAGNDHNSNVFYPAGYTNVVSVSAVTIDQTLASYSNFGSTIDVAAPGGDSTDENGDGYPDGVLSTVGDDSSGKIEMGYAFSMGTSMAAPHVSGVVALMKALYPGLTPDAFDALLVGGYLTQDIGDPGRDNQFGYGLIDAYKAVLIAREGGSNGEVPAVLAATPDVLNFGTLLNRAAVTIKNGGGGSLTLTDYYSDAPWLSATASTDVDADTGLGTYTVEVIREGLSDGIYTGRVSFASSANQVDVSVVMQVASVTVAADGGYHYILLLDPDTLSTVDQQSLKGENGLYPYEFSNLSYGATYIVYAGTDPNNDGYICDDGEACGAYLSLDQPVKLTVIQDEPDLDFTTNIIVNIPDVSVARSGGVGLPIQRDIFKEVVK